MRHSALVTFGLVVLWHGAVFAQAGQPPNPVPWQPYLDVTYWSASDAVELRQLDGDWSTGYSPKDGQNDMLLRRRTAIGMENGQWRIAWEAREEAGLHTDGATLGLFRHYKQRTDPDGGTRTEAQLRYTRWSAKGLRIHRWFDGFSVAGMRPRLALSAGLYTSSLQLRDEQVSGSVYVDQAGTYTFSAAHRRADNRSNYPFMRHLPVADGASVSVTLDWPVTETLSLMFSADDLWSRIRWNNLPVMQRVANSDVDERDGSGFVNYRATLTGTNNQVSKAFSISPAYSAALAYRKREWRIAANIERWSGVTMPALALTRHLGWGSVTAQMATRFRTFGFGVEVGKLRIHVQSDKLRLSDAKAFGAHLGYATAIP